MGRHSKARPGTYHKATMLGALLIQRENLDTLDLASIARSYGLAAADVSAAIATEKMRRLTAGRSA